MRREARSMASHRQTLRLRWPTNVHISSSSSTSGFLRWAFFDRRRGSRGETSAAFFYQLGNGHPRHAGRTHDVALRVALAKQGFHLGILRYCAVLATAAGTKRAWYPHVLHWYFGWPPCVPLRRMCSLPQRAHKCCV